MKTVSNLTHVGPPSVYGNNAMLLRRNVWAHSLLKERLDNYTRLEI